MQSLYLFVQFTEALDLYIAIVLLFIFIYTCMYVYNSYFYLSLFSLDAHFTCMSISISVSIRTVCNIESKEKTQSNSSYVCTYLADKTDSDINFWENGCSLLLKWHCCTFLWKQLNLHLMTSSSWVHRRLLLPFVISLLW